MSISTSSGTSQTSVTKNSKPLRERAATAARKELDARKRARSSLIEFTRFTNPSYSAAACHYKFAKALEAVERGEISRLMVMAPPRHGKSELVSRRFPAWYLGRHPDRDFISASYNQELANDFGRDVRNIIGAAEYQRLFSTRLAQDSQAKNRFHVANSRGGYVAAGVGTATTGRGAHIFNIDDPHKDRLSAESEPEREAVWNWYRSVAYTRLAPGGAIILTLTRWHEEDLAGKLLAAEESGDGDKWVKVILPAIDEHGRALWEERYPKAVLEQIRNVVGPYDWASLYEQRPRPREGRFFEESCLLVDGKPLGELPKPDKIFTVVDTAMKDGAQHDGTACITFAVYDHKQLGDVRLVIVDYDVLQINAELLIDWLPGKIREAQEFANFTGARYGFVGAWIEEASSGIVLLGEARRRGLQVEAIDTKLTSVGKEGRALATSGYYTAGAMKITQYAFDKVVDYRGMRKNHLLDQIASFRIGMKRGGHNLDLVDCMTYGLSIALGDSEGW